MSFVLIFKLLVPLKYILLCAVHAYRKLNCIKHVNFILSEKPYQRIHKAMQLIYIQVMQNMDTENENYDPPWIGRYGSFCRIHSK